jgi:prevent-host-death family protein
MTRTTITQAKNGLSALIDRVKAGETIVILDRGTPVARLEPMAKGQDADGRRQRLARAGLATPGVAPPPTDVIRDSGPRLARGASIAAALIDERRSGR